MLQQVLEVTSFNSRIHAGHLLNELLKYSYVPVQKFLILRAGWFIEFRPLCVCVCVCVCTLC
jgi:hypothetical protein